MATTTVELEIKKDAFSDEDIIKTVAKPGKKINSGEKDGGAVTWDAAQIETILGKQ